jgi:hypothetical protein
MTSSRLWDRAASLPVPSDGERPRPEVPALTAGSLPTVAELFTFARDAELRFSTLRMRIDETTQGVEGARLIRIEVTLRHPGAAKVSTSEPARGVAGGHEIWISDGETVRTYAAAHHLGTRRPVRRPVAGLEDHDLPGTSRVYRPFTALPMETLPETFIHPGNFCQNVLATGDCSIIGIDRVADREAIVLACDRPRTVERVGDRPDFRMDVAFDRGTGVITRLVETMGDRVTRHAEVTVLQPDASLPPGALDFEFPEGTTFIY